QGIRPEEAIQMVTINPATYFGLDHVGVLSPGKQADIAIIEDIFEMTIAGVFLKGKLVASKRELLIDLPKYTYPEEVKQSVKIGPITEKDLEIQGEGNNAVVRCIEVIPDQNLTGKTEETLRVNRGVVEADPAKDTLYIACIERYNRTGNIGRAFVKGFGLKEGAFAESVAHDTHNILVTGTNIKDMTVAVNAVIEMGGGIAIANKGRILSEMRLPVGGLITDELDGHEVSEKIAELERIITRELGCKIHAPLMHLSFLALSTSPAWKITDKGLIDVNNFKILPPVIK
ncbi:adenine deaminase C-terminal domain-containing protein, partial [Tissierella sp.]|uniref:adenine deaminase C-terminal domain-containing protein n=1 Tax=Tissierella sp. TaxID=41274 RepID=UPI0030DCBEFF